MTRWSLARFEWLKLGFPVTQHIGFNPNDVADFSNLEVNLVRETRWHSVKLGRGGIDSLLQDLAWLEGKDLTALDGNLVPGLWIPSISWAFSVNDKVSESGNLNLFAFFQVTFNYLKGGLHNVRSLLFRKTHFLVNSGYDVRLSHGQLNPTYGNQ